MKIDTCLRDAVVNIDLSSWETRYGATALAIVLLEKIFRAESKESDNMQRYLGLVEREDVWPGESTNNLIPLGHAASMLYYAYGLIHYRRLGIGVHLCNINVFRSLADCL